MKKVLIMILAVLLLVSFTSCDTQKKIDEAVADAEEKAVAREEATVDFCETFNIVSIYRSILQNDKLYNCTYDLSKFDDSSSSGTDSPYENAKSAISVLLGTEKKRDSWDTGSSCKDASGTVDISVKDDGTVVFNAKNVKISWTDKSSKKQEFSLEGEIKYKATENGVEFEVTSFVLHGITYKPITAKITYDEENVGSFTEAICNETALNCDFITGCYKYYL